MLGGRCKTAKWNIPLSFAKHHASGMTILTMKYQVDCQILGTRYVTRNSSILLSIQKLNILQCSIQPIPKPGPFSHFGLYIINDIKKEDYSIN